MISILKNSHRSTLLPLMMVCIILFPVHTINAGYASIFSELTVSGSAIGSGSFNLNNNPLVTSYTVAVTANSSLGSQIGGNGFTSGGDASVSIGPFTQTATIIPPGGDPFSISADENRTITKNASGDWIIDGQNVGSVISVSGYVNAYGNDMIGTAYAGAEIHWLDPTVGTINVTANNPSATWTISGPVTVTGNGSNSNYPNQQTGTYVITWGAIPGFITPATQSFTLAANGAITFTGNYVPSAASVNLKFR